MRAGLAWGVAALLLWSCVAVRGSRRVELALRCCAALLVGLWLAGQGMRPPDGCFLPADRATEKVWLEGVVGDEPARFADGMRVPLRAVLDPQGSRRPICGTVLLTVLEGGVDLSVGDRLRAHVHLRRPRNFRNPGAYDQVGALARRGVWATGYARAKATTVIGRERAGWRGTVSRQRARIGRLIDASVGAREASLLRALVIGDTGKVPDELWDAVSRAGLVHLLSVSGLHIGIVWGLGFAALRWLGSRSERLLLLADVRALAGLAAMLPAGFYGVLAGSSVPTERSVLMVLLFVAAAMVGRELRPLRSLALAATVLAVARPGAPLEISFQLSFAAVLSLIVAVGWWTSRAREALAISDFRSRLRNGFAVGLIVPTAALLGTAPLVAFHFNRVSLAGLLANPILVPLCGTPATVLGLFGAAASFASDDAARIVFRLAGWPLAWLASASKVAAALPFAAPRLPTPTVLEIVLAYALLALPWLPSGRRTVAAAALVCVVIGDAAFWLHDRYLHADLRLRFLDVGQGDSTVIELPRGGVMVVDGGGFSRSRFDVGERVVARYLRTRRILRIDVIVASHGDWDHQGGLHALARDFRPRELWRGAHAGDASRLARLESEVAAGGGRVRLLRPGDRVDMTAGLSVDCLHPPADAGTLSANDASLVLRLSFGATSVLLTGDVEAAGEGMILSRGAAAPAAILKAPHHGSATSSRETFVSAVRPEVAVFSLGAGNPFRFPAPEVLARYRLIGARILRTDVDGSVSLVSDGRRISVRPYARASPLLCAGSGALC